jgi:hypothetical protein
MSKPKKASAGKSAQPKSQAGAAQAQPDNELKTQQEAAAGKDKKSGKPDEAPAAKKAKPAAPPQTKPEPAKAKPKKAKLVRDSFTMPENEYQIIGEIKKACIEAGFSIKKSELLRVGVALLQKMTPAQIQESLADLPALKAGRPKKDGDARPSAPQVRA